MVCPVALGFPLIRPLGEKGRVRRDIAYTPEDNIAEQVPPEFHVSTYKFADAVVPDEKLNDYLPRRHKKTLTLVGFVDREKISRAKTLLSPLTQCSAAPHRADGPSDAGAKWRPCQRTGACRFR